MINPLARTFTRPSFLAACLVLSFLLGSCSSSTTTNNNNPAGTFVVPGSITFGTISSGQWHQLEFVVSNTSTNTVLVSGCTFGGASSAGSVAKDTVDASRFPLSLAPGMDDTLTVQFDPANFGAQTIVDSIHYSIGTLTGQIAKVVVNANVGSGFTQTNLVSDTAGFGAAHIDPLLVDAWGLVMGLHPWISANGSGTSTFYDTSGGSASSIGIPLPNGKPGGAPSGIVGSFGSDYFVFSTEDGTIAGWSGAATASIVSDSSGSGAVYKGLAMVASANQLYATDFHNNTINVFNTSFKVVNSFTDPTVPTGFGPFGITNINDTLYVTYARQKVGAHDDSAGVSVGFVDRFTPAGVMIGGHFASGGNLNSPWGIALAPASFGQFAGAILIGNFGDGKITAYDRTGTVLGQLMNTSGSTVSIDGLWAISFNTVVGSDPNKLFFTAGPDGETHGLFGFLHP